MRYFLFLARPERLLPSGIIEASWSAGLVFFSGPFKRGISSRFSTRAGTIAITPITTGTEDDLGLAAATMIKTGRALHRQKGR